MTATIPTENCVCGRQRPRGGQCVCGCFSRSSQTPSAQEKINTIKRRLNHADVYDNPYALVADLLNIIEGRED